MITVNLYSIESVLIDFNKLNDTTVDFSSGASAVLTAEEKEIMKVDLSPRNWRAKINASSRTFEGLTKTYAQQVSTSATYPGTTLLGIRVFFPERGANSYAEIKPPFEIPSYYDSKTNPNGKGEMFLSKGVIRNVGVLRKISVRVLGNNYKYSLHLIIKNRDNETKYVFMGYLNFIGWQTLTWVNSNYDTETYQRSLDRFNRPYYPDEYPYIRLEGFFIQRIDPNTSGNFVTMIKDITVEYDPQFPEIGNETIDKQESTFGIYENDLIDRAKGEMQRVNKRLYDEWLEKKKMN
jgi:hypothetical protein